MTFWPRSHLHLEDGRNKSQHKPDKSAQNGHVMHLPWCCHDAERIIKGHAINIRTVKLWNAHIALLKSAFTGNKITVTSALSSTGHINDSIAFLCITTCSQDNGILSFWGKLSHFNQNHVKCVWNVMNTACYLLGKTSKIFNILVVPYFKIVFIVSYLFCWN